VESSCRRLGGRCHGHLFDISTRRDASSTGRRFQISAPRVRSTAVAGAIDGYAITTSLSEVGADVDSVDPRSRMQVHRRSQAHFEN